MLEIVKPVQSTAVYTDKITTVDKTIFLQEFNPPEFFPKLIIWIAVIYGS